MKATSTSVGRWAATLVVAGLFGGIMAGCGGGGSTTSRSTTTNLVSTTNPGPTTTEVGPSPTSDSGPPPTVTPVTRTPTPKVCTTDCAVGDDGMQYRVTDARRFTDRFSHAVVAVGFTIINRSSQGHDFAPLTGGFSAVTASGGTIQSTDYEGQASGDPRCYDPSTIDVGGTDASIYHINQGQTFPMPKEMCMVVPAGQAVAQIQFADQDATSNATATLSHPV
jgi:hypothetical protein